MTTWPMVAMVIDPTRGKKLIGGINLRQNFVLDSVDLRETKISYLKLEFLVINYGFIHILIIV
jgi:hypothetical protein